MPKTTKKQKEGGGGGKSAKKDGAPPKSAKKGTGKKDGKKGRGSGGGGSRVQMAKILTGGGLTAQRFAGKPLRQPGYSFRDAPRCPCPRTLAGSALYEVSRREDFNDAMAEMVLLCNEVMRRQAQARQQAGKGGKQKKVTTKPLSLEYIADRMDVDDPLWGFFVRTAGANAAAAAAASANLHGGASAAAAAPAVLPAAKKGYVRIPLTPESARSAAAEKSDDGNDQEGEGEEEKDGGRRRPRRAAAAAAAAAVAAQPKAEAASANAPLPTPPTAETQSGQSAASSAAAAATPASAAPAPAGAPAETASRGDDEKLSGESNEEGERSRKRPRRAAASPAAAATQQAQNNALAPAPAAEARSQGSAAASTAPVAAAAAAAVAPPSSIPPTIPSSDPTPVKEGMLQGFVTVTTFTNWQKSFRWDSMHDSAFSYDDPTLAAEMTSGRRKFDRDGSLAEEMQATVRCGDPWNEGIVWPHIAEISLLGGLGCGGALVRLVVERLERMPPTGKRNYDFLVLQATDNSVPFYENMGFVRVGCITENEDFKEEKKQEGESDSETETEPESDNNGEEKKDCSPKAKQIASAYSSPSSSKAEKAAGAEKATAATDKDEAAAGAGAEPSPFEIVSSAVDTYTTTKSMRVSEIAKILNVNVWDIIFLNHYVYKHMAPSSKVKKGTELFVPNVERARADACSHGLRNRNLHGGRSGAIQWYYSLDNETPRDIAAKFDVGCADLIRGNRDRMPDLQPLSRLHENTRIKVSHFDVHDDRHVPYCHWTFPDDTLETSEPSYMMAMKLNHKAGPAGKFRPVEASLAVPATKYEASKVASLSSSSEHGSSAAASSVPDATPGKQKGSRKRKRAVEERHPDEPERPKRPMTAYFFYMSEMRDVLKNEMQTNVMKDISRAIAQKWNDLPEADKVKYRDMSEKSRANYEAALKKYETDMEAFRKANPEWVKEQEERKRAAALADATDESSCGASIGSSKKARHLFNKIVKLNEEGRREAGTEFEYYYVLTYLPDLQWCHLAPLRKAGVWGKDKPKAEGRPKWMLVSESEGKEVDISAGVCEIVRSRALRNNPDADKEQWDIPESGPPAPAESAALASTKKTPANRDGVTTENGENSRVSADSASGTSMGGSTENQTAHPATSTAAKKSAAYGSAKKAAPVASPKKKTKATPVASPKKKTKASATKGPATAASPKKKAKAAAAKGPSAAKGAPASQDSSDECFICYDGGELICCDFCDKAFHMECHIPPLTKIPPGKWKCCECAAVERTKLSRCGECDACIRPDCGKCKSCLDKPKFGGSNKLKQACVLKSCPNKRYAPTPVVSPKKKGQATKANAPTPLTSPKKKAKAKAAKGPATPVASSKKKSKATPAKKTARGSGKKIPKKGPATPVAASKRTFRGSGKKTSARKAAAGSSKPAKLASPFRIAKEASAKKNEVPQPEPELVLAPRRQTRSGREFN